MREHPRTGECWRVVAGRYVRCNVGYELHCARADELHAHLAPVDTASANTSSVALHVFVHAWAERMHDAEQGRPNLITGLRLNGIVTQAEPSSQCFGISRRRGGGGAMEKREIRGGGVGGSVLPERLAGRGEEGRVAGNKQDGAQYGEFLRG